MENLRFSDSYDTDYNIVSSLKKSVESSIKPKFITKLDETQNFNSQMFSKFKQTESTKILKPSLNSTQLPLFFDKSVNNNKNQEYRLQKIQESLNLLKKTTVYEDKSVNVFSLFERAEILVQINHQNKRAIKFIQTTEKVSNRLMIQKTQWRYFSRFQGMGILILPDNRKIKGQWRNSIPVGKMLVTYPNQSIYYGFINAELQKHGNGIIYFKNGQKLQGRFSLGRMFGSGVYYNTQGEVKKNFKFKNGLLISTKRA